MSARDASSTLHHGHRERLRARFLEDGLDGLKDHQVLELLLFYAIPRADTNPIAHRLMRRFGSLSTVLGADPKDIASVEGMGDKVAAFLSPISQVTRRYFHDRVNRDNPPLTSSEAVTEYLVPLMAGRPEEVFYVLCLDSKCRVVYLPWLSSLQNNGYAVDLVFLWLPGPEMAVARVAERVCLGGHDVPEAVIRRRDRRGLENFFRLYRSVANRWWLLDNSGPEGPRLIACGERGSVDDVTDHATWTNLVEQFR